MKRTFWLWQFPMGPLMMGNSTWGSAAVVVVSIRSPFDTWNNKMVRWAKSIHRLLKNQRQSLKIPSTVELALSWDPNASITNCRLVRRSFRADLLTASDQPERWRDQEGQSPSHQQLVYHGRTPSRVMFILLGAPLKRVVSGRIMTLWLRYPKPNANRSVKWHQRSAIGSPEWLICESQLT